MIPTFLKLQSVEVESTYIQEKKLRESEDIMKTIVTNQLKTRTNELPIDDFIQTYRHNIYTPQ